ncbi:hypothetical protein [Yoonia sp. 208BN28-4]|uniref:hypothetical protein n=1 Tax=Yoonia sp. 208BN28-4 TaxID=3126505 RepID=UPI0030AF0298
MNRTVYTAIAFALVSATQAAAAPCVSPTFDVPLPGATDVTSHVTDLPSSAFPAFWQEGRLDGYEYRIFANASGVLQGERDGQPWRIEVSCDANDKTCSQTEIGPAPAPAMQVAERIGQCLVPPPPVAEVADEAQNEEQPTPVSKVEPAAPQVVAPAETEAVVECGIALVNEATEIATMQRLLLLLREDPGPVDGFLGPQTFAAMAPFIDNPGWSTPISDAVTVLSEKHCALAR